jgi:hypothetical protein
MRRPFLTALTCWFERSLWGQGTRSFSENFPCGPAVEAGGEQTEGLEEMA